MSEHLTDRLTSTAHALKGSRAYSASVVEDAIAEIERLRTLLSEAEHREKDAEARAEMHARSYADLLAKNQGSEQQIIEILKPIARAVGINDGDTLSRLCKDERQVWTASGSWSGSAHVTLGDLRKIAEFSRSLQSEDR